MPAESPEFNRTPTHDFPVLVLGVGNLLLRDEGVGVHVVRAMQEMHLPPHAEVLDGATAGLDLLDVIADRQKLIVIDAVDGHCAPGTVLRLGAADLAPSRAPGMSLHDTGVADTLAAARALGVAPAELVVFGVVPAEHGWGLDLSPRVAAALPEVIESVRAELGISQGVGSCQGTRWKETMP